MAMAKVMGKGVGVHNLLSHTNAAEPQHWARHRRLEPPHLRASETDGGNSGCEMLMRRNCPFSRSGFQDKGKEIGGGGGATDPLDLSTSTTTIKQRQHANQATPHFTDPLTYGQKKLPSSKLNPAQPSTPVPQTPNSDTSTYLTQAPNQPLGGLVELPTRKSKSQILPLPTVWLAISSVSRSHRRAKTAPLGVTHARVLGFMEWGCCELVRLTAGL